MTSEESTEPEQESKSDDPQQPATQLQSEQWFSGVRSGLRSAVEFFGEHPFVTGLLALVGVLGFGLSAIGFFIDRDEAEETTEQLARVEASLATVKSEVEVQRGYIRNSAKAFLSVKTQLAELDLSDEELWQKALKTVANDSGIPVLELEGAIALFVASVGQDEDAAKMDLALARFASGEFDSAGDLALLAAEDAAEKRMAAERLVEQAADVLDRALNEQRSAWTLVGQSRMAAGRHAQAVAAFESALQVRTDLREVNPVAWASIQVALGDAALHCADVSEGEEIQDRFQQSVSAYRQALMVHTRDKLPQSWAKTQNALATAISEQAFASSEPERSRLLEESVSLIRLALEVRTREVSPHDWAMAKVHLGSSLREMALGSSGPDRTRLLEETVTAYRQALEVFTLEAKSKGWAATQNNLANALSDQALASSGADQIRLFEEAVTAYRRSLEVSTRDTMPREWALSQNNLGIALSDQAFASSGHDRARLLGEAVAAYRQVLEVRTREAMPQSWASTQNNLANALSDQALASSGPDQALLFEEAVSAFRLALQVRTRDSLPQSWAITQSNLALTLLEHAKISEGEDELRLLQEAANAMKSSLQIWTEEAAPDMFAPRLEWIEEVEEEMRARSMDQSQIEPQ